MIANPRSQGFQPMEVEVTGRLAKSTYGELRNIRCLCHGGTVILRGRVSSYYLKQRAQAEVQSVNSVQEVNNQLDVAPKL